MVIKIIKVNVEINLSDLVDDNKINESSKKLPTVNVNFDNNKNKLNNNKIWYKTYTAGNKWVRIEGNGETPSNVENIIVRRSPGNEDIIEDKIKFDHPIFKIGLFDDYPKNLYVQAIKLEQLLNIGYIEGDSNLIELVD